MTAPEGTFTYDAFISYRHPPPDGEWVKSFLVPALDQAGLRVFVDYRSQDLGKAIISIMAEAVVASRYTVAVMSPAYFESGFTDLERIMAQHLGLEEGQRRFIGLMLEECDPPLELRPFLWLDMTAASDDQAPQLSRLIDVLRGPTEDGG